MPLSGELRGAHPCPVCTPPERAPGRPSCPACTPPGRASGAPVLPGLHASRESFQGARPARPARLPGELRGAHPGPGGTPL